MHFHRSSKRYKYAERSHSSPGTEKAPVVLSVELSRTLHELVGKASPQQLVQALSQTMARKWSLASQHHIGQLKQTVHNVLGECISPDTFHTNTENLFQADFQHFLVDTVVNCFRKGFSSAKANGNLKELAHSSISRMCRADRIAFGKELQNLDIREEECELPLPLCAWFNVLQFLDLKDLLSTVSRVCRAWFLSSMNDQLWALITNLRFALLPPQKDIGMFCRKLSGLVSVEFTLGNCSDPVLSHFAKFSPNLKELKAPNSHAISDAGIKALAQTCANLSVLDIESCERVSDGCLEDFSRCCSSLKEINLKYCRSLSDVGIVALVSNCTFLTKLNLNYCNISDASLVGIGQHCVRLEKLSIKYCRNITNMGLIALSRNCTSLKVVTLSYCHRISDEGVSSLARNCIGMQELNLKYCRSITSESVKHVARNCTQLLDLNLNYCELVSDEAIIELGRHSHKLKRLKLDFCKEITDISVKELAQGCNRLSHLSLDGCFLLTDSSIENLCTHCPMLTTLDLNSCQAITNSSLKTIAKHLKFLSKLVLSACTNISDTGLQELLPLGLKSISLEDCPNVSESMRSRLGSKGVQVS